MQNYLSYLKIFFNSRWIFKPPKQKKILIYDGNSNPFKEYFKERDYNIFFRRGEEINLYLISKMILNLNISADSYTELFLDYAKPKIIITAIDNNHKFYGLKKKFSIPTAFVQNGTRTNWGDIFSKKEIIKKSNKKIFEVDFMFVFNETIAKKYNSFISGKTFSIGSFKNNINLKNIKQNKKKEILFISTFKLGKAGKRSLLDKVFYKNDDIVIRHISEFAKKNNIKFNVLGRSMGILSGTSETEKNYYNNICTESYKFIPNYKDRKTYEIVSDYKYILTIDSTLGIENLARGERTAFLFNRPYKFPIHTRRYGGTENLPRRGPNWTTYNKTSEFNRVLKYLFINNEKNWKKTHLKFTKKTMEYDSGNKKFLKIINRCIK